MLDRLREPLLADGRVAYALVFGSAARGTRHAHSDVDVAIGLRPGARIEPLELGDLIGRLEAAAGAPVDLVILDEAPAPLAYRAFRDGQVLFERDHGRLVRHKARAIVEYLDFKPVEERCEAGVLAAARRAARGR